jgi:pimeloyl-ACP methyl ester carboxylesterase
MSTNNNCLFLLPILLTLIGLLRWILYPSIHDILIDQNRRWGNGDEYNNNNMQEFMIPKGNQQDIQNQLNRFLLMNADHHNQHNNNNNDWNSGIPLSELYRYITYWNNSYNWDERRMLLQNMGHHRTTIINGLTIHYVDIINPANNHHKNTIVCLHGWPGSFVEFSIVGPELAKRDDIYRVIIPSLPGYGFSEGANIEGFTFVDAAAIFIKLIHQHLHIGTYTCHGGDYGSFICAAMAQLEEINNVPTEKKISSIHLNMVTVVIPPLYVGSMLAWPIYYLIGPYLLPEGDWKRLTRQGLSHGMFDFYKYILQETGYFHIQATKPEMMGAILNDSPVGLAAYFLDKFKSWSSSPPPPSPNSNKKMENGIYASINQIFDNLQIYYITQTGTTSVRYYRDSVQSWDKSFMSLAAPIPSSVKIGLIDSPGEFFRPPRSWLGTKYPNLIHYSEFNSGGHFLALEQPILLVNDLIEFINKVK